MLVTETEDFNGDFSGKRQDILLHMCPPMHGNSTLVRDFMAEKQNGLSVGHGCVTPW